MKFRRRFKAFLLVHDDAGKFFNKSPYFIPHAPVMTRCFFLVSGAFRQAGWIVKSSMKTLDLPWKNGTGFCRLVANGDHIVKGLRNELVEVVLATECIRSDLRMEDRADQNGCIR